MPRAKGLPAGHAGLAQPGSGRVEGRGLGSYPPPPFPSGERTAILVVDERKREYDVSGAAGRFVVIPVSGTCWGVYDTAYHTLLAERKRKEDLPTYDDLADDLVGRVRESVRVEWREP